MNQLGFEDLLVRGRADRRRKRPGPKPGPRPAERHRARPLHRPATPLLITLRGVAGLPSFRRQTLFRAFDRAFRDTRREDFRIVEFSVQDDHVHLLVEADDSAALSRGMKSFSVRANRLYNAAHGRGRGRVWADRYHRRDLTSPRQVRNALVYTLQNAKKHFRIRHGRPSLDPCSSGPWFQGWTAVRTPRPEEGPPPTERATTWLLRVGWRRHGLIHPGEAPRRAF